MNIILLGLLLLYQTVLSIMDARDMKKYRYKEITERMRIGFYKETIIYGWIPVFLIFLFIFFSPLSVHEIGLRKIVISEFFWLNIIVFIISFIILAVLLYQIILYFTNENYMKQLSEEVKERKESGNHYQEVLTNLVIPRTKREKIYFFFVSLTAGICEEIVWRGCLLHLLTDLFPTANFFILCLIICFLFGMAHCYQGLYGIMKTSIIAVLFVGIFLATNSLIPGIILHFLFDFSSAFLLKDV